MLLLLPLAPCLCNCGSPIVVVGVVAVVIVAVVVVVAVVAVVIVAVVVAVVIVAVVVVVSPRMVGFIMLCCGCCCQGGLDGIALLSMFVCA